MKTDYVIHQLTEKDPNLMDELLTTFGEVFNDQDTYSGNRPGSDYIRQLRRNAGRTSFSSRLTRALKMKPP